MSARSQQPRSWVSARKPLTCFSAECATITSRGSGPVNGDRRSAAARAFQVDEPLARDDVIDELRHPVGEVHRHQAAAKLGQQVERPRPADLVVRRVVAEPEVSGGDEVATESIICSR